MDVAEHVYTDDPTQGPPDAKTTLAGVDYFFLGNGLIQAAVQVCTSGQGTPVGLLILHPEQLRSKRRALTFDPQHGLAPTAVTIRVGTRVFAPQGPTLEARWADIGGVPAVQVTWQADDLRVTEIFYCHDQRSPCLTRIIRVRKSSPGNLRAALRTGPEQDPREYPLELTRDARCRMSRVGAGMAARSLCVGQTLHRTTPRRPATGNAAPRSPARRRRWSISSAPPGTSFRRRLRPRA